MVSTMITGLLYIVLGGICSGTFAIPFKKNTGWQWENNWFVWSFAALLITPWIVGLTTVPELFASITADRYALLVVVISGLLWGYGAILFGKGIDILGVSLGIPIMLGLINSVGTLAPIVIKDSTSLLTMSGLKIIAGVVIMLIGIVLYSIAGGRKSDAQKRQNTESVKSNRFKRGIIISILAGVFGPMINIAFVVGEPMSNYAIASGTSAINAANPIWCVALSTGFIVNVIACIISFRKNDTWKIYRGNTKGVAFAAIGGVIWYVSIMLYGMGGGILGSSGASLGWATMQSTAIIAGAMAGIIAGEWRGASSVSLRYMFGGLICLILGLIVIAI